MCSKSNCDEERRFGSSDFSGKHGVYSKRGRQRSDTERVGQRGTGHIVDNFGFFEDFFFYNFQECFCGNLATAHSSEAECNFDTIVER